MNQPNTDYWLNLAAQWIQSKSQTQMSFPNYPFSQMAIPSIPQVPAPPRISNHNDATANDNLVEADMEIEDEKDEIGNWQNEQQQQLLAAPRFPAAGKPQKSYESRFSTIQIPHAPIISGQTSESSRSSFQGADSNHVDMVLDSDHENEDESNSAIIEAQRRKKLPLWIREGLEKMEREKKQEQMRLVREKEMAKSEESRKKIMEEALKEIEQEKKFSKSKYVRNNIK